MVIMAIIQIFVLLYFFKLANNVKLMKQKYCYADDLFLQKFIFFVSLGEKEEAKKLLLDKIMHEEEVFPRAFSRKKEDSEGCRQYLIERYSSHLALVGLTFSSEDVVRVIGAIYDKKEVPQN